MMTPPIEQTSTKVADNANVVHLQEIHPKDSTFANQVHFIPKRWKIAPMDVATLATDAGVDRASRSAVVDIIAPLGSRGSCHSDVKVECYVDGVEYVKDWDPRVTSCLNILRDLPSSTASRNLAALYLDSVRILRVKGLPRSYNGLVVFNIPPDEPSMDSKSNTGLEPKFDGHVWTKSNSYGLLGLPKFLKVRKKNYAGHLQCKNMACLYRVKTKEHSKTAYKGHTDKIIKVNMQFLREVSQMLPLQEEAVSGCPLLCGTLYCEVLPSEDDNGHHSHRLPPPSRESST
jgi:hypothetical protein